MTAKKKTKKKTGRPSKYKDEFPRQAMQLCLLGATDKQIAEFFSISLATLNNWKNQHGEFMDALNEGKQIADASVVKSLYVRALGYSHPEEKIFCNKDGQVTRVQTVKHYAPDTTACIFWLKNRDRENWRDRQELTGPDGKPLVEPVLNVTVGDKSDTSRKTGSGA